MSDRALAYSTEPLRAIEHRKSALAKLNRGDGADGRCESLRAIASGLHRNPLRFVAGSQACTSSA